MTDSTKTGKDVVDVNADTGNNGKDGADDHLTSGDKDKNVPLATFLDMKKNAKLLEDELKQMKADQKARDDAKLKEEGKLQELITAKEKELSDVQGQMTILQTKVDEFEQFKTSKIDWAKSQLGDKWNDEYSKLSLTALDNLVNSMVAKPAGIGTDGGASGDKIKVELTVAQKKEAEILYPHIPKERAYEYHLHNLVKTGKIKPKE